MAAEHMRTWKVGNVEITRIVEVDGHVDPLSVLLADGSPELMKRYDWLFPHFATPEGDMRISFQCFVLKAGDRRIMIDTCIGNDRQRMFDIFTNMQTSFLDDIARAGCPAAGIDTVLCTHLHFDHVGWNTQLVGGRWVPTFPNARYLFGRTEWEHWQKADRAGDAHAAHLTDSVDPILDAGLADFVEADHLISDEIALVSTPGHTPGHVSVHIDSGGRRAVITGDMMHHPVQFAVPHMPGNFCMDKELSCRTRRQFIERYADGETLVIGSHFCEPTAGRIVRDGEAWRFDIGS
jgi:glyoxylase-like metal-dependent hydrolase (beta-lactamase superfamily II)